MTVIPNEATAVSTPLADALATVAAKLSSSTVQVCGHRSGNGSGVIWRSGLIITNAHVISGSRATVKLSDGRILDAVCTSQDRERDLAALAVEATDLPAAIIGDSSTLRVGELVLAIGNPSGIKSALTTGIVHAIKPTDASSSQRWVMADVRLAPGNSGGPLANARGQVVGINTMIADGLALAVPSNAVERFLHGSEQRPYLGVSVQPVFVPQADKRLFGLLLVEVGSGSPADLAGLLIGDVLIGASSQFFSGLTDLSNVLHNAAGGGLLTLNVIRGGKHIAIDISLQRHEMNAVEAA